jgi:hypothetical protein
MRAQKIGLIAAGILMAGCASNEVAQRDTLNDRSDRLQALEDRLPPNPNRPADSRELKSVPTVVQHDPALNKPQADQREDKGLAVNAGQDQLVRPQDPTLTPDAKEAPKAVGGTATTEQVSVAKGDSDLAAKVREAISNLKNKDANLAAETTSQNDSTSGEAKAPANLEVTAKNGAVTISGSVDSEAERTAMEQAATKVTGVTSVANYLTVTKSNPQ